MPEEVQYNNRYLCFPPCKPPLVLHDIIIVHSSRVCKNGGKQRWHPCICQYTDAILTSLHSFIKRDGSCAPIYRQVVGAQPPEVKCVRTKHYEFHTSHSVYFRPSLPPRPICRFLQRSGSKTRVSPTEVGWTEHWSLPLSIRLLLALYQLSYHHGTVGAICVHVVPWWLVC